MSRSQGNFQYRGWPITEGQSFSLFQNVPISFGAHPVLYLVDTWGGGGQVAQGVMLTISLHLACKDEE
jgi:hypothetical protein